MQFETGTYSKRNSIGWANSYKVLINCSQVVTGGSGNKILQTTEQFAFFQCNCDRRRAWVLFFDSVFSQRCWHMPQPVKMVSLARFKHFSFCLLSFVFSPLYFILFFLLPYYRTMVVPSHSICVFRDITRKFGGLETNIKRNEILTGFIQNIKKSKSFGILKSLPWKKNPIW